MAKFISVMNHELTEEQKKDAINTFAEVNDMENDFDTIPFPQIDPKSTSKEMDDLVAKYESEIVAKNPSEVLLQGEMIFTRRLTEKLKQHNINVVAARSERVSIETKRPDGTTTKTATFQHRGFLSYFTEEEVKKIKENRIKDKLEKYVNKKNSLIKNDSEFQKIKTDDIIVSPINDLESFEIVKTLLDNGYELNKNLFVTLQPWGASWEKLESYIKNDLQNYPSDKIYGVELIGNIGYNNIDHHSYGDDNRENERSSIEQIADLVNYKLSTIKNLISQNDKAFIPGMQKYLEENNVGDEADKKDLIKKIRELDRFTQGISLELESQALESIKNKQVLDSGLWVVDLPHSKCATVTDRCFGDYENMLIVCDDGEFDFYGKGEICKTLNERYSGWCGGDLSTSGFWGISGIKKEELAAVKEKTILTINTEIEKIKQKEAMSKAKVDISQKKEEMKNIKKLLNDKTEVGKEKDKDIDLDLF